MRLIAGALLVAMLASASALAEAASLTDKGIKAGLNIASMTGDFYDDLPGKESRVGFAGGIFVEIGLSDILAIQPEMLYTMKGVKGSWEELGVPVENTFKFDYLEIPVLLKLKMPTNAGIKPALFVGPALGILLSAKMSTEVKLMGFGFGVDTDIKEITKATDFGLVLGGSLDIGKIILDLRYNLGLSSVDDSGADEDAKNGVFQAMVGYSF